MQLDIREAILAGRGEPSLLMVEHEPVITLGRRGGDLALPRDDLARRGVDVVDVERGGLATYHGPGQLVGYPILPLARFCLTVPEFVALLEEVMIGHAASLGLDAHRREGWPGVWVGRIKIGAVGLHLHRGVSIHGFALNLTTDPAAYRQLVPCGIGPRQGAVGTIEQLAGRAEPPEEAAPAVAERLLGALVR